jgi:hypothetical protein
MNNEHLTGMLHADFSLTPWLQPSEKRAGIVTNRFNGFPLRAEAVETTLVARSTSFHRAEATVLIR